MALALLTTAAPFVGADPEPPTPGALLDASSLPAGETLPFLAGETIRVPGDFTVDGTLRVLPKPGPATLFTLQVEGILTIRGALDASGAPTFWRTGPLAPDGVSVYLRASEGIRVEEGGGIFAGDGAKGRWSYAQGSGWFARAQAGGMGGSIVLEAPSVEILGRIVPGDGGHGGAALAGLGADAEGGNGGDGGLATALYARGSAILGSGSGGDGGLAYAYGNSLHGLARRSGLMLPAQDDECPTPCVREPGGGDGCTFCMEAPPAPDTDDPWGDLVPWEGPIPTADDLLPDTGGGEPIIEGLPGIPGVDHIETPPIVQEMLVYVLENRPRTPSTRALSEEVQERTDNLTNPTVPTVPTLATPTVPTLPTVPPTIPTIPTQPPVCPDCIEPPEDIPGPGPQTVCTVPVLTIPATCWRTDEPLPVPAVLDTVDAVVTQIHVPSASPQGCGTHDVRAPDGAMGFASNGGAGGHAEAKGCKGTDGIDGRDGGSILGIICTNGTKGGDADNGGNSGGAYGGDGGDAFDAWGEASPGRGGDATTEGGKGGDGGDGGKPGNAYVAYCHGGDGGNAGYGGDAGTAQAGDGGVYRHFLNVILDICGGGGLASSQGGLAGRRGQAGAGGENGEPGDDGTPGTALDGERCRASSGW